ncbi:MAG: alpha-amylase family protein [Bacteroidaceae bacterium]|nr:alpha-amylase family protein [Bacteroidaceae bacterium]
MIIYQIFTRLFGNDNTTNKPHGTLEDNGCGKMDFYTPAVLSRIKKLGVTHVWLTGVIRHATTTDYSSYGVPRQHPSVVKGLAGSPYAICDYYDIDPDLATKPENRMAEFEALVGRIHKAGLKVIIDFVPNHVARQYQSITKPEEVKDLGENDKKDYHFSVQNNFYYCWGQSFVAPTATDGDCADAYEETPAKATGNDCFSNAPGRNDWYETVKLNYGVDYCDAGGRSQHFNPIPDTWNKMTSILLFWTGKGVDGFRCDMAEMVPSAFWYWATDKVKCLNPEVKFIGEVYNPAQYREYLGAGFDYLYDKVGLYDCLKAVVRGECSAQAITQQWQNVNDIQQHMLNFLENHDEQRVASPFFAGNAQKGIPALVVSTMLNTNPFMLYAGEEFGEKGMDAEGFSGEDGRTTIFDYWNPVSLYHGYVKRAKLTAEEKRIEKQHINILGIAANEKAVTEGKTFDLMYANPQSEEFNAHRVFAFMRSSEACGESVSNGRKESLLIVANFSDEAESVAVNIPQHALDYMGIKADDYGATDLVSGDDYVIKLSSEEPVRLIVPANNAVVLKF